MQSKVLSWIFVLLLIIPLTSASHNRYDPLVNLYDIDWLDRELYLGSLSNQDCVDLDEFFAYADSDPYDRLSRKDLLRYKNRLSYSDYTRVANLQQYDRLDPDDFRELWDFYCSTPYEYNQFADSNRYDRYDRDDYYGIYGYPNARSYRTQTRHYPYERSYVDYSPYYRADSYGGYASRIPFSELTSYFPSGRSVPSNYGSQNYYY